MCVCVCARCLQVFEASGVTRVPATGTFIVKEAEEEEEEGEGEDADRV